MHMSTVEILNREMECLLEKLGVIEAEQFISLVIREKFDYTKWQQEHFDKLSPEQIDADAKQYVSEHPFKGKAEIVL